MTGKLEKDDNTEPQRIDLHPSQEHDPRHERKEVWGSDKTRARLRNRYLRGMFEKVASHTDVDGRFLFVAREHPHLGGWGNGRKAGRRAMWKANEIKIKNSPKESSQVPFHGRKPKTGGEKSWRGGDTAKENFPISNDPDKKGNIHDQGATKRGGTWAGDTVTMKTPPPSERRTREGGR